MNIYLVIIVGFMVGHYLWELGVDALNLKAARRPIPEEFADAFAGEDAIKKIHKTQNYLREKTQLGWIKGGVSVIVLVLLIISGAFNALDLWVRSWGYGSVLNGLLFMGVFMLASLLLRLPFSYYSTFVIEAEYGFNKMTRATFLGDTAKGLLLTVLLGGPLLALVLVFFEHMGSWAWLWVWVMLSVFQLIMMFVAPVLIMPLFNKFTPLPEGDLRAEIEHYAHEHNFAMQGVFTMDGSKRSTKTNAYFTGFGRFRRIVLFDTLVEKHTVPELVSVLAHEMGHYRKKHILSSLVLSIATAGLSCYVLGQFLGNAQLFAAFSMDNMSVYAGLLFFGLLYAPVEYVLGIAAAIISRRHEYEADRYAVETYGQPEAMVSALKKLSVDNLSQLTPHPLKVFLEYSHPPVVQRIRAIRRCV